MQDCVCWLQRYSRLVLSSTSFLSLITKLKEKSTKKTDICLSFSLSKKLKLFVIIEKRNKEETPLHYKTQQNNNKDEL